MKMKASLPYSTAIVWILATTSLTVAPLCNAQQSSGPGGADSRPAGGWGALWSPDGSKIAFLSQLPGEPPNLWVMDADGTNPHRLTTQGAHNVRWTSEGLRILFTTVSKGKAECHGVSLRGEEQARPFPQLPASTTEIAPSPDGKRLAYATSHGQAKAYYVAEAEGTHPVHVTTLYSWRDLAWSPQSNFFVLQGSYSPAGQGYLWVYNVAKKVIARLGQPGAQDPTWRPDAKALAYSSALPPVGYSLAMCDVESGQGSVIRKLVHTGEGIAWSPDGNLLAVTVREATKEDNLSCLSIIQPDGKQTLKIGDKELMARFPVWSPDGKMIAFEGQKRRESYTSEIWVADAVTGSTRRLISSQSSDWSPTPSPDGKDVAFLSTRNHRTQLWVARSEGTKSRALIDVGAEARIGWSMDSRRMIVADANGFWLVTPSFQGTAKPSRLEIKERPAFGYMSLSPNRKLLAYTAMVSGKGKRALMCIKDLKVPEPSCLFADLPPETPVDLYPTWSHDGKWIAFLRGKELWVTQPDGKDAHAVASFADASAQGSADANPAASDTQASSKVELSFPTWVRDDGQLVLTALRYGADKVSSPPKREVWGVELRGGKTSLLDAEALNTEFSQNVYSYSGPPALAIDGKVLLNSDREGIPQIWMAEAGAKSPRRLSDRYATHPVPLPEGNVLFVSSSEEGTSIYLLEVSTGTVRPWLHSLATKAQR